MFPKFDRQTRHRINLNVKDDMAQKLLQNYQVVGALYRSPGGPEIQAGDEVRIFLDQTRNPGFPESISGIAQIPLKRVNILQGDCIVEGTSYTFSYESDDLLGAADHIDPCDVLEVSATACCLLLRDALDEEIAARTEADAAIQADLDTWDVIEADSEPQDGYAGVAQMETLTATQSVALGGAAEVEVTSALVSKVINFAVGSGASTATLIQQIATALENDPDIAEHFEIDNIGSDLTATAKVAAANDPTVDFTVRPISTTGFATFSSTNTNPGDAPIEATPADRIGQHAHYQGKIYECTGLAPTVWKELIRRDDVSLGGNGVADAEKVVGFGPEGGLTVIRDGNSGVAIEVSAPDFSATGIRITGGNEGNGLVCDMPSDESTGITVNITGDSVALRAVDPGFGGGLLELDGDGVTQFRVNSNGGVQTSAAFSEALRTALGIPTYADETAANAALNVGDIYFNTALGVCRAATA